MSYQQDPYQQGNQGQPWNPAQDQDPYQQSSQDPNQQGMQDPRNPNQQNPQWAQSQQQDPNQQGMQDQSQDPTMQGMQQDPNMQGNQGQSGMFDRGKQMAQGQANQGIDQYGNKIPGGQDYTQRAKDTASDAFDNTEQDADDRFGNLGGNQGM